MNISDFTQTFNRETGLKMTDNFPRIIIPDIFYDATVEICNTTNRETRGVLICKKFPNSSFLIESVLVLGTGTSYEVFPEEKRLRAAQALLSRHPEFIAVDFHSHTTGTGESFYENFSSDDISSLARAVSGYNGYMHVLFTPTHICTFGLQQPYFCVAEITNRTPDQLISRFAEILNEFNELRTFED